MLRHCKPPEQLHQCRFLPGQVREASLDASCAYKRTSASYASPMLLGSIKAAMCGLVDWQAVAVASTVSVRSMARILCFLRHITEPEPGMCAGARPE